MTDFFDQEVHRGSLSMSLFSLLWPTTYVSEGKFFITLDGQSEKELKVGKSILVPDGTVAIWEHETSLANSSPSTWWRRASHSRRRSSRRQLCRWPQWNWNGTRCRDYSRVSSPSHCRPKTELNSTEHRRAGHRFGLKQLSDAVARAEHPGLDLSHLYSTRPSLKSIKNPLSRLDFHHRQRTRQGR